MDFLEKAFEKFWTPRRQKWKKSEQTVQLKHIQKFIRTILLYQFPELKNIQINGSLWTVGFIGDDLYLPDQIGLFNDKEKNLWSYISLTLKACASKKMSVYSQIKSRSKMALRLETLVLYEKLLNEVAIDFPYFLEKENSFLQDLEQLTGEKLKFYMDRKNDLFLKVKTNDQVCDLLMYLVPGLPVLDSASQIQNISTNDQTAKQDSKPQTHKQNERQEYTRRPDDENKEEEINPVMHSFEKMETADDYDGKRRIADGDDDLESHLKALDEVELNQLTSSAVKTKSIYQADMMGTSTFRQMEKKERTNPRSFFYPEWNHKKENYIDDHCQIFESQKTKEIKTNQEDIIASVKKKYKTDLLRWERKIQSLFNEPLWLKKQKDGSEIDLDAVLRFEVERRLQFNPTENIYCEKVKNETDTTLLMLFDQSMSTDSWVGGERVLSVIQESLALVSLLFENIDFRCMVAGTSSETHKKIDFRIYKEFDEKWSIFREVVDQIEPEGYTRLGPAVRHATERLQKNSSRKKILLIFTDGKPTDLDAYEGRYGISDVHKAVLEAEKKSILTWALTVDTHAKSHFSTMFSHYSILPRPQLFADELIRILIKALKR